MNDLTKINNNKIDKIINITIKPVNFSGDGDIRQNEKASIVNKWNTENKIKLLSIFLKDTADLFLEHLKTIKRKLVLGFQKELLNKFQPINKYRDKSLYHRSQINISRENNHKRTPEKYKNKITIVILIDDSIIEKISVQEHQKDIKITIGIPMNDSIVEKTAS